MMRSTVFLHLVHLIAKKDGEVIINIQYIASIRRRSSTSHTTKDGKRERDTTIFMTDGRSYTIAESYEKVIEKITEAL